MWGRAQISPRDPFHEEEIRHFEAAPGAQHHSAGRLPFPSRTKRLVVKLLNDLTMQLRQQNETAPACESHNSQAQGKTQ